MPWHRAAFVFVCLVHLTELAASGSSKLSQVLFVRPRHGCVCACVHAHVSIAPRVDVWRLLPLPAVRSALMDVGAPSPLGSPTAGSAAPGRPAGGHPTFPGLRSHRAVFHGGCPVLPPHPGGTTAQVSPCLTLVPLSPSAPLRSCPGRREVVLAVVLARRSLSIFSWHSLAICRPSLEKRPFPVLVHLCGLVVCDF